MLAGIFAAAAAPAIVRADSLMKIYVPSNEIYVGRGLTKYITLIDETGYHELFREVFYRTIVMTPDDLDVSSSYAFVDPVFYKTSESQEKSVKDARLKRMIQKSFNNASHGARIKDYM
jgi:hypothetical protein